MDENELRDVIAATGRRSHVTPGDGPDGTLLYGYDIERTTRHVWRQDGLIHMAVYSGVEGREGFELLEHRSGEALDAELLVPSKRAYPEACDYGFCMRLAAAGQPIPFARMGMAREAPEGPFWGYVPETASAPSP